LEVAAACVLFSGVLPLASSAQDWHAAIHGALVKEPVLGLLNLPDVVTADCIASAAVIQLRGAPSNAAPAAGSLQQPKPCELMVRRPGPGAAEELPTSESDYELPAAIVLQREGSWFRIALQQGSAWIERANSGDFLPYPNLLKDRLTYLGMGWDGRLL
jgi:hypothetical protein